MDQYDINKLESLQIKKILQKSNLTLSYVFNIPNILDKIKNQISLFINYCIQNQNFAQQLIKNAMKHSLNQNQNQNNQTHKFSYIAIEILTIDDKIIQKFFIFPDQINEDTKQHFSEQQKQIYLHKHFKYLIIIFDQLCAGEVKQICLNYFLQIIKCLLINNKHKIILFLDKYQNHADLLINHCNNFEVAVFFTAIFSEDCKEDNCKKRKYKLYKKYVQFVEKNMNFQLDNLFQLTSLIILQFSRYQIVETPIFLFDIVTDLVAPQKINCFIFNITKKYQNFNLFQNSISFILSILQPTVRKLKIMQSTIQILQNEILNLIDNLSNIDKVVCKKEYILVRLKYLQIIEKLTFIETNKQWLFLPIEKRMKTLNLYLKHMIQQIAENMYFDKLAIIFDQLVLLNSETIFDQTSILMFLSSIKYLKKQVIKIPALMKIITIFYVHLKTQNQEAKQFFTFCQEINFVQFLNNFEQAFLQQTQFLFKQPPQQFIIFQTAISKIKQQQNVKNKYSSISQTKNANVILNLNKSKIETRMLKIKQKKQQFQIGQQLKTKDHEKTSNIQEPFIFNRIACFSERCII